MASQQYRIVFQHWKLAMYKLHTGCMFGRNERKITNFVGRILAVHCQMRDWMCFGRVGNPFTNIPKYCERSGQYGKGSLVKSVIGCVLAVWIILSPTLRNIMKD